MSTIQHPLTDETRDLLVGHIAHGTIDCSSEEGRYDSLTAADARGIVDSLWGPMAEAALAAVRDHERTTNPAAETDRPWEPLNGPVRAGDEVRQELRGVTTTAVVGRVDGEGDPWTAEDRFIGVLDEGTWYVRRTGQELPTTDGAVIIPADGREFIEAEVNGQTFITREAVVCQSEFGPANVLEGAWRRFDNGARAGGQLSRGSITPGTWKVEGQ